MTETASAKIAPARTGPIPGKYHTALLGYLLILGLIFLVEWGPILVGMAFRHQSVPFRSPLFDPAGRFDDWNKLLPRTLHFGEPGMLSRRDLGLPYQYPLPSIWIFVLFEHLFRNTLGAYLVCASAIFGLATTAFSLYLRRLRAGRLAQAVVWSTMLLGSPALFLIDRGNIEVFLWLLMLGGSVCFFRNRPYAAAVLFALAAAMKIYPALLLLLFLARRQPRAFFVGVTIALGVSLVSLQAVGPSIPAALHDLSWGARVLRDEQIVALAEFALRFDHSLFGFAKQSIFTVMTVRHQAGALPPRFPRLLSVYSVLAPLAFAAVYWFRVRKLPMLNQFVALIVLAVLLPYVSYEYTLVHLYLCAGAFLLYLREQGGGPRERPSRTVAGAALACFAVIFAPLARLTGYHFQAQVKCLALIALLILFLANPMPSRLAGDLEASPGPA